MLCSLLWGNGSVARFVGANLRMNAAEGVRRGLVGGDAGVTVLER